MFNDARAVNKLQMISAEMALPGRDEPMPMTNRHYVNDHPIVAPFPEHLQQVVVGMGCFWGAERLFWQMPGVFSTSVGYAGGFTPNPNYREVCSGQTGHAEVVLVVFDPAEVGFGQLLQLFWEGHDPTQGMRQGNDGGKSLNSLLTIRVNWQAVLAVCKRLSFCWRMCCTTPIQPPLRIVVLNRCSKACCLSLKLRLRC